MSPPGLACRKKAASSWQTFTKDAGRSRRFGGGRYHHGNLGQADSRRQRPATHGRPLAHQEGSRIRRGSRRKPKRLTVVIEEQPADYGVAHVLPRIPRPLPPGITWIARFRHCRSEWRTQKIISQDLEGVVTRIHDAGPASTAAIRRHRHHRIDDMPSRRSARQRSRADAAGGALLRRHAAGWRQLCSPPNPQAPLALRAPRVEAVRRAQYGAKPQAAK